MSVKNIRIRAAVMLSMLSALYVVSDRFLSFSTVNMRIGFSFVPLALAGFLFGAQQAACCAAAGDIIGMMLFPNGAYFPGFTLNAFLTGLVFGLFLYKNITPARLISCILINQFLLGLFVQTLWIHILYGSPYLSLLPLRLVQCVINVFIQFGVVMLMKKSLAGVLRRLPAIN